MGADDVAVTPDPRVVKTPCQLDREVTGREWADDLPPKRRTEIQEMATLCSGCPMIRACSQRAERLERDHGSGTIGGVWGGEWWRDGQAIDPWGDEDGDMRSVYRYVWYDRQRGAWRAEKIQDGKRYYITSSKEEHVAGEAAWRWRLKHGDV